MGKKVDDVVDAAAPVAQAHDLLSTRQRGKQCLFFSSCSLPFSPVGVRASDDYFFQTLAATGSSAISLYIFTEGGYGQTEEGFS
jgi:hypothetical protein